MKLSSLAPLLLAAICLTACRGDELVVPPEHETPDGAQDFSSGVRGLYLLNEGNMGSNKSTLDYLDYATGVYSRNIYASRNPTAVKELGDVGNDIAIYGSKMYAVINCSHKVEVMDAATGVRLGQIDIPNCRYVAFHGGSAYVSSYVGPVQVDPSAPRGAVYRVDTATLRVTGHVEVGYQPEQMAVVDGYLYVANSGGYRAPDYDNTVSAIRLSDFVEEAKIPVGPNLNHLLRDRRGRLWVQSRGDYKTITSHIYLMDRRSGSRLLQPVDTFDVEATNMVLKGDSLLYFSSGYNKYTGDVRPSYGILDIVTLRTLPGPFVSPEVQASIRMPYGLAVHPLNGDIYLTDAKNYVSSGTLYCLTPLGALRWSVRTGDIPAAFAFLPK